MLTINSLPILNKLLLMDADKKSDQSSLSTTTTLLTSSFNHISLFVIKKASLSITILSFLLNFFKDKYFYYMKQQK